MKDIHLILVASFLVYFSAFAFGWVSASDRGEDEREHARVVATGSINSSHRSETAKERLERVREEQKKKLEKLKEEQKKKLEQNKKLEKNKKNGTGSLVGSGTTQKPKTGTGVVSGGTSGTPTNTGTTTTAPTTKTQTVSYGTPDGSVNIGFSVTTNNGVITAASSTTMVGWTSGYYQNVFAAGLSQAVVGKKVAGLSLAAIGGASLTTNAFVKFAAQ